MALAHLGAARRVEALECGPGARERLLSRLGSDATLVSTLSDLTKISTRGE